MDFELQEGGSIQLEDIPHFPDGSDPGGTIWENDPLLTPTYIQSLGIMLCETYAALHKRGVYFGQLHGADVHINAEGRLSLDPSGLTKEGSKEEDLLSLVSFLKLLLPDDSNDPAFPIVTEPLSMTYPDAATLKSALITGKAKKVHASRRGVLGLLLCVFCLAGAILAVRLIPHRVVPVSANAEVDPGVIGVWIPMPENADEQAVADMYTRLAAGFERQYPGCGVNIRIYADDSFEDAIIRIGQEQQLPAVFMDTQNELVLARAADLSPLTSSLADHYITDMTAFSQSIPIGCSVPVLYYNAGSDIGQLEKNGSVRFDQLPSGTIFDSSVEALVAGQDTAQKTGDYFSAFLQDNSIPVLASSSLLPQVDGENTKAVQILPVSTDAGIALQYETFCVINDDATANDQRIGMLWLGYLLTEEAQEIMYTEHFGDLPLHRDAFKDTIKTHSALKPVESILKNGGDR